MGYLKLPEGKRIAVNLGVDVDARPFMAGGRPTVAILYVTRRVCVQLAHQGF